MNAADPMLGELVYACPASATELLSVKNKLAKVKLPESRSHGLFVELQSLHTKYIDDATKLKQLKGLIISPAQVKAKAKEVKAAELHKKTTDSKSLVDVLLTHKDEFIKRNGEIAHTYYTRHYDILKKNDYDINKIEPYPKTTLGQTLFRAAIQRRDFYKTLLASNLNNMVEQAKQDAEADFMAWVHKMISKIGKPVVEADMSGNPWTDSTIHVKCIDGEEQSWSTQMIVNQSKYGKLFNQFPSRKLK